MATKYDLTGKKVGKLTVIRLLDIEERPTKTHGNYWLCKCECGNENSETAKFCSECGKTKPENNEAELA